MLFQCKKCGIQRDFEAEDSAIGEGWKPHHRGGLLCLSCSLAIIEKMVSVRVSTWDLDEFVSYVQASLVDEYLEDPDVFLEDLENYADQMPEEMEMTR